MKVTFFTENSHSGGMDSFLITLVNNWPSDSDKLTLICNQNHPGLINIEKRLSRPCSIIRHKLPVYGEIVANKKILSGTNVMARTISFLFRYLLFGYYLLILPRLLLKNNPDRLMVVAGGYPGGDTCRAAIIVWGILRKKTRAIFNFHNLAMKPSWYSKCFEYPIDYLVAFFSKQFITVSNASAQSMSRRALIDRTKKTSFIYNGIDNLNYNTVGSGSPLKNELGIPDSSKICLMLGTYEPRKGHRFLFQAFKKVVEKMPSAHLVVCGYGRPKEVEIVHDLVAEFDLKKHVRLLGFRNDISYLLQNTNILVVASQDYESFGLTCVEAMAYRIPVVATRVGGLPEVVIDGESGYCIEPDDINGYASKILALLSNEELRQQQGEKGFQRYKNMFTGKRMAVDYRQAICS